MPKQRRYEDVENNINQSSNECVIKYVPTRREVDSLVIDNYLFQRVSASTNKDGSIGWRCKEYRRGTRCQSTCRIGVNGEILRCPSAHNHPQVSEAELVFMKAKANAKKRCRTEENISVQKIFLQEMGKAIVLSGLKLTSDDLKLLPKFEANKRCLQIQRKIGLDTKSTSASNSDNGDDQGSVNSSDENSVKDEGEELVSGGLFFFNSKVKNEPHEIELFSSKKLHVVDEDSIKSEALEDSHSNNSSFASNYSLKRSKVLKRKTITCIVDGLWDLQRSG